MNKKNRMSTYLPFFVVGLTALIWHIVIKIEAGDDVVYFQTLMDGRSIFEILAHRYETWSSRMAIEFVMIPLVNHPVLWKLIDTIVFTTIPVLMYQILLSGDREDENAAMLRWTLCGFVLLYPFSDMVSAGWIATTTNYLWPLWCLLFMVLLLKKIAAQSKIRWQEALAGTFACIYGSSQEQVAVILFVILILAMVYLFRRKKYSLQLLYLFTVLDLISLISILACPGNAVRSAQEAQGRMPGFETMTVWQKLYMGTANVERIFLANVDTVFLVITLSLVILVYIKTRNYEKTLISAAPIAVLAGYSVIRISHPWYEKIFVVPGQTSAWDFKNYETYLPLFFLLMAVAGMLFALYQLLGSVIERYVYMVLLLGVGLASGVVMGFSPTIYASANRPYIYLYFILIMAILFCIKKMSRQIDAEISVTAKRLMATILAAFCIINIAEVLWMCHIM